MSWLETLSAELRARGIIGREHHRIVLELRDHITCEPGCEDRLGDPEELAAEFADELATDRARRSALDAFAALAAATGFALLGGAIGVAAAGPEPEDPASDLPSGCAPRRDS
jgi:hypothetical protein